MDVIYEWHLLGRPKDLGVRGTKLAHVLPDSDLTFFFHLLAVLYLSVVNGAEEVLLTRL